MLYRSCLDCGVQKSKPSARPRCQSCAQRERRARVPRKAFYTVCAVCGTAKSRSLGTRCRSCGQAARQKSNPGRKRMHPMYNTCDCGSVKSRVSAMCKRCSAEARYWACPETIVDGTRCNIRCLRGKSCGACRQSIKRTGRARGKPEDVTLDACKCGRRKHVEALECWRCYQGIVSKATAVAAFVTDRTEQAAKCLRELAAMLGPRITLEQLEQRIYP